jgi:hypothetical protein
MNQVKLFLIGIIFIGTLLLGIGVYLALKPNEVVQNVAISSNNQPIPSSTPAGTNKTIVLHANQSGWQSIGTGTFTLKATGTVDYGGEKANPDTSQRIGDSTSLLADAPFGTLIGKIGENGKPFKVGSVYKFNATETIYVAINDSIYEDNTGSYNVTISK